MDLYNRDGERSDREGQEGRTFGMLMPRILLNYVVPEGGKLLNSKVKYLITVPHFPRVQH